MCKTFLVPRYLSQSTHHQKFKRRDSDRGRQGDTEGKEAISRHLHPTHQEIRASKGETQKTTPPIGCPSAPVCCSADAIRLWEGLCDMLGEWRLCTSVMVRSGGSGSSLMAPESNDLPPQLAKPKPYASLLVSWRKRGSDKSWGSGR